MATRDLNYALDFTQKLPLATQEKIADGMAQVDANADPKWKHIFDGCVLAAAVRLQELTSDDVLEEYEKLGHAPGTHNMAAIGPAMSRAAKMGILRRTDRVVRSKRLGKNGNRHNIWLSNYFNGTVTGASQ